MGRNEDETTKLPKRMSDEISKTVGRGALRPKNKAKGQQIRAQRKAERKATRELKKIQRRRPWLLSETARAARAAAHARNEQKIKEAKLQASRQWTPKTTPKVVKPIVKKSKKSKNTKKKRENVKETPAKESPESPDRTPKAAGRLSTALAEDDAKIAALEKKLGIKRKKKAAENSSEDALEGLLGTLDDDEIEDPRDNRKKRKRPEDDEWLRSKRRKAEGVDSSSGETSSEDDDGDSSEVDLSGSGDDIESEGGDSENQDAAASEEDTQSGVDSTSAESSEAAVAPPKKRRENPYLPPTVSSSEGKQEQYVPPPLRASASSEKDDLIRLRRQSQGLLNRLSEANLVSIMAQVEQLYRSHPRQHVTSTLADLLLGLVADRSTLSDTFLILHAAFVAAVYKVVGMDFGAFFLQKLVEKFDQVYESLDQSTVADTTSREGARECINLVALLSELYNLQVVGTAVMFDYIRLFLDQISEANTELLLKITRSSGPQLRQHDPSTLKDIVLLLRQKIAQFGEDRLSVRSKFMVETINDLKNNKIRSTAGISLRSESLAQMRKILGSLHTRKHPSYEPLRVSLRDIRNPEKKGAWWLGASGASNHDADAAENQIGSRGLENMGAADGHGSDDESGAPSLLQLAREQHMNTDVRRDIFVAIMSATDYRDAHLRLTKLRLKRAQEKEIPRVLIHCAGMEQVCNPYYTLIARKLCMDRRLKKCFQFSLWGLFRVMGDGEGDEDDEDEDERLDADEEDVGNEAGSLSMRKVVNLAKMYGSLVADGSLDLTILKVLNFPYLQTKTQTFVELFFITVFLVTQQRKSGGRDEKAIVDIFMALDDHPSLARGIHYFLKNVVGGTDVAGGKAEQRTVQWGCKVAANVLMGIVTADVGQA